MLFYMSIQVQHYPFNSKFMQCRQYSKQSFQAISSSQEQQTALTASSSGFYPAAAITPLNKRFKGSSSHISGKVEKNSKKTAMKHMSTLLRNV